MISTKGQVKTRALALLNDPNQGAYKDEVFDEAFNEAWDALRSAMLRYSIPFINTITTYTVPAHTTSFAPSDAGIDGFGELIELEERSPNTNTRFMHVTERDKLGQRDPGDSLGEFVWRQDRFQLIGAIQPVEVRITYWDTGGSYPSDDGAAAGADGAIAFLAKYSAAAMAPRKGEMELADRYKAEAVGAQYDSGGLGGELFRLIQPMVVHRQSVPTAPKPYSVIRRRWQRRQPYIAANQPPGGGSVPAIFSLYDGSITGIADGVNDTFYLPYPVSRVVVHLNGPALTPVQAYIHGANVITFVPPFIPQPGADLMVEGWL